MTDILISRDGPVGIITINRPQRLNAVAPETGSRINDALRGLEAEPEVRAIVLTGAGRGFCAGADISGEVGDAGVVLRDIWNPLITTMRNLDVPIVAAVNGVAAGAGVSLALACDLRVAAASARFQLSFTKIGLLPDAGLTWLLPRTVGLGRANELSLLARDLRAAEALQWGLVNELCEDGTTLDRATVMARVIAGQSSSVSAAKRAIQRALECSFSDQLHYEATTQAWLQEQPDFKESTAAFAEKRTPIRVPRTLR
ncbi:enoyl-CoA hydratase/isomerase family protein [Mycobacterium vicinigordonae]|uniref:Enoyl-CoA hydratase/isomerase family protein n=1 Tax=Mycobacterium vicinigordonae TaxID=1719132 RepID=A0A7D6DYI1_9MYCO|nr:enoyl-CoA hydratase-related protein [Mycobacterium vicinigordonae]QLL07568.1 enoyl-CoA hydratase/isomerase family protein [Mycobacterium vicinigordonae]